MHVLKFVNEDWLMIPKPFRASSTDFAELIEFDQWSRVHVKDLLPSLYN